MLYYIVIKLVYSLIVRGWHNRAHTSIDTLHGNKYSLAISQIPLLSEYILILE
jgi:hypothetical protein